MDIALLQLQIDASGAVTAYARFATAAASAATAVTTSSNSINISINNVVNNFGKMADSVVKSSHDAEGGITAFGIAAGEIIAELIIKVGELAFELGKDIFKETIESGLEFNDQMEQTEVTVSGLLERMRPDIARDWTSAMSASTDVMKEMYNQSQKVHVPLNDLSQIFQYVMQGSDGLNKSLEEQITMTAQLGAAVQIADPAAGAMQRARDTMDLFQGRDQTAIGRTIINQGGMDSSTGKSVEEEYKTATDAAGRWNAILAGANNIAISATHSNEILSLSFHNLEASIQAAMGDETKPLYEDMVDAVNKIRETLDLVDFDGFMKPFIEDLQTATKVAGSLALTLTTNNMDGFKSLLSASFDVAVNEMFVTMDSLVNSMFEPTLQNAMLQGLAKFGDLLMDVALRFGSAIQSFLSSAVQASGISRELEIAAYKASGGNTKDAPNPLDYNNPKGPFYDPSAGITGNYSAYRTARANYYDQKLGMQYSPNQSMQDSYQDFQKNNQGFISGWDQQLKGDETNTGSDPNSSLIASQKHLAEVIQQNSAYANQAIAEGVTKSLGASSIRDLNGQGGGIESGGNAPGGRISIGSVDLASRSDAVAQALNKQQMLEQVSSQMENDRLQLMIAQSTQDENQVQQIQAKIKGEEAEVALIRQGKESMGDIQILGDAIAQNELAILQHKQDQKAVMADQKDILSQINAAEKVASTDAAIASQVKSNPFETDLQKRAPVTDAYSNEISALQQVIQLSQEAIDTGKLKNQAAVIESQERIEKSKEEIVQLQNEKALQTDAGQFNADFVKWQNGLGTMGSQAAGVLTGTLNEAINSVSGNIDKVIQGTETWGDAFKNIGQQIIQTLEELTVKMLVTQALQSAIGNPGSSGGNGVAATPATGIFSVLAGIGSTVSASHTGGVVGSEPTFSMGLPRFHTGGMSGDEQLAVLKKGESVLTPGQMRAISGGSSQKSQSGNPIHLHVTNISDPAAAANHMAKNPDTFLNILGSRRSQARAILGFTG